MSDGRIERLETKALKAREERKIDKDAEYSQLEDFLDDLVNESRADPCDGPLIKRHCNDASASPEEKMSTSTGSEDPCGSESSSTVVEAKSSSFLNYFVLVDEESQLVSEQCRDEMNSSDDGLPSDIEDSSDDGLPSDIEGSSDDGLPSDIEEDSEEYSGEVGLHHNPENVSDDCSDNFQEEGEKHPDKKLASKLASWSVKHHIKMTALSKLLVLLKENGHPNLPKTSKTLLCTPRSTKDNIRDLNGGGKFWYYGILNGMKSQLTSAVLSNVSDQCIVIDIFTDGLSPYKSVRTQLWPIAGCLKDKKTPFLIALWCGETKEPQDLDAFWEDFIKEAEQLKEGFYFNDKFYKLEIRKYMADALARIWIKNVNTHNCKIACERCTVGGHYVDHRMTINPCDVGTLRTDESFLNKDQNEYHKGNSPLLKLNTKMISQIPLDTMHMVYLGTMKRLLVRLCERKKSTYTLSKTKKAELSSLCFLMSKYVPSDFPRITRSFSDLNYFKASEFRRISRYDGFVLFKRLPSEVFDNFLLFACSLRILGDPRLLQDYADDANDLLNDFVKHSHDLYGKSFIVFNIHHLTHLAEECRRHGTLEEISCFKYENYLYELKKLLYAPGRPLPQVVCRVMERVATLPVEELHTTDSAPSFQQPHGYGPTLDCRGQQFLKLVTPAFVFRISGNDSYCLTKTAEVVWIQNIIKCNDGPWIIGQKFKFKSDYFKKPLPSSCLDIFKVHTLEPLQKWHLREVKSKIVLFPLNAKDDKVDWNSNEGLCLPMLPHDI